jgi:hypothetical protein
MNGLPEWIGFVIAAGTRLLNMDRADGDGQQEACSSVQDLACICIAGAEIAPLGRFRLSGSPAHTDMSGRYRKKQHKSCQWPMSHLFDLITVSFKIFDKKYRTVIPKYWAILFHLWEDGSIDVIAD